MIELARQPVIVDDQTGRLGHGQRRIHRTGEPDQERLVHFNRNIADDFHNNRFAGLARTERQRTIGRHVIQARQRRAVGGRVIDRHRLAAGIGQIHGEQRIPQPGVALHHGRVADRQRRQQHGGCLRDDVVAGKRVGLRPRDSGGVGDRPAGGGRHQDVHRRRRGAGKRADRPRHGPAVEAGAALRDVGRPERHAGRQEVRYGHARRRSGASVGHADRVRQSRSGADRVRRISYEHGDVVSIQHGEAGGLAGMAIGVRCAQDQVGGQDCGCHRSAPYSVAEDTRQCRRNRDGLRCSYCVA